MNSVSLVAKLNFIKFIHITSLFLIILMILEYIYFPKLYIFLLFSIYIISFFYKFYLLTEISKYDKDKHKSFGTKHKNS
jgi:hypothetical protein